MISAVILLPFLLAVELGAAENSPQILIGPNLLVSRDGDIPHVEPILAINPRDPKNLLGAAITATRPEGGMACRTYSSLDGGATWRASDFPEQVEWGGGDPLVVFTPHGTAIFVSLARGSMTDDTGRKRGGMHVYRSENGGRTWTGTVDICCSHDHPQMVVDNTLGRFAGRIYIGTLSGYPVYSVGIFRSDDDGRSFIGPVEAANGGGEIGINVVDILVLSDGTLVVPYVDFEFKPEKKPKTGRTSMNIWFKTSADGGLTFSEARRSHFIDVNLDDPFYRQGAGVPAIAADSTNGEFRDRLYMAWSDMRFGKSRILFSSSTNRGESWSEPVLLDGEIPAEARQFMPEMTVNKDGVLGVLWLDTRESVEEGFYHAYFTASLDGGESFLPRVRVSSAPSDTYGSGNLLMSPSTFAYQGALYLTFTSAAGRWPAGGDYIGLATDSSGAFRPLWPDARTGTFQLYTTDLRVDVPKTRKAEGTSPAGPPPDAPEPPTRAETSLEDKVEFVFDPTRYDGEAQTAEISVRLKNISDDAIYPPIRLEIVGFGIDREGEEVDEGKIPTVLNPDNGNTGIGASFNFDDALGNLESLAPQALTGSVVLRMKVPDPLNIPWTEFVVTGQVEQR